MSNTICNTSIIFQLSKTTTTHEKENKMSITYTNGKMNCATAGRGTATRKTNSLYAEAVVGRRKRDGKFMVVFASGAFGKSAAALMTHNSGKFVNFNFHDCTDFEIVTATPSEIAFTTEQRRLAYQAWRIEAGYAA